MIGFFRHPVIRMLSSWTHSPSPWGWENVKFINASKRGKDMTFQEYLQNMAGCQTKSLTRGVPYPCTEASPVKPKELDAALEILRGFAFIGLTDEWELSICLWHAMFGGDLYSIELANIRPHRKNVSNDVVTKITNEVRLDFADGAIYFAAKSWFHEKLLQFDVTKEKCEKFCAQEAHELNFSIADS